MGSDSSISNEIMEIMNNSLLIATDISNNADIKLVVTNSVNAEFAKYHVSIKNCSNFYFQKFESSIQRSGFMNLRRMKISKEQQEWIKKIQHWDNVFTKESGIEIQLYNGSILRFVGNPLLVEKTAVEKIDSMNYNSSDRPSEIRKTAAIVVSNQKISLPKKAEIEERSDTVLENDQQIIGSVDEDSEVVVAKLQSQIDQTTYDANDNREQLEISYNNDLEDALEKIDNLSEPGDTGPSLLDQIGDYATPFDVQVQTIDSDDDKKIDLSDITIVDGVSKAHKSDIEALGFSDIPKLAEASIQELVSIRGIGKATARKIIKDANRIINE